MKTIFNLTAIFLMFLFGWYFLFIAIAEPVNTERILDYRMYQVKEEMKEVNNGQR